MGNRPVAALTVLALVLAAGPVDAARALPDTGKWNNYFALFAPDTVAPWKHLAVRLDTYSGAPVDFAAYDVDPADVLVAGANAKARPLDTSRATPAARWRFTPPAGLGFVSNAVDVPLQNREGFFVIEARRGDAVQQVWLNLTRVGLIAKEAPAGSTIYGTDLGTGRALAGMRVTYLVGTHFAYGKTDAHGLDRVPPHARFALAEWGRSKAFVSFLPQSPPPAAVVAVRVDHAAVRAGEPVRVVGFVRRRNGDAYRPGGGEATLNLAGGGRTLATVRVPLDGAGAFAGSLTVPADLPTGEAAILASADGASGGATVHVDALGTVALAIATPCTSTCPADAPIPVTVVATHGGAPAPSEQLRLRIVRTPHVLPPQTAGSASEWGTTRILDRVLTTAADGTVKVTIPAAGDGLPSTYGIEAGVGSASASTRLVAPTAKLALSIVPDSANVGPAQPLGFEIRGFDALDGTPAAGVKVHVRLSHGPTVQENDVELSAFGTARLVFRNASLGMNLARAEAEVDGKRAVDMTAVTVAPSSVGREGATGGGEVKIAFDRSRVKPGERVAVTASVPGAVGEALLTMESAAGVATVVVPVQNGVAGTSLAVPDGLGAIAVGAALVRDGAVVAGTAPLIVDGPGRQRTLALRADKAAYPPGAAATVTVDDGGDRSAATLAIRLTDRRSAEGASFESIGGILSSSGTTTQNTAASDPPWHAFVAPARSTASDIVGLEATPPNRPADDSIAPEGTRVLLWRIERQTGGPFTVALPREPGRYLLSVVKMTDEGDVGSAALPLLVQ